MEETFVEILRSEFARRNNPTDLKAMVIGKVVKLNPLTVQIAQGEILLEIGEDFEVSETFRLRCNIDIEGALSGDVPSLLDAATSVVETHSYSGAACLLPDAISNLASAILKVKDELLNLKCDLRVGDYVVLGSLVELNKYILLDKVG